MKSAQIAGEGLEAFLVNMSFVFWIVTVVMAVIALSFLVLPIIKKHEKPANTVWLVVAGVPLLAMGLYTVLGRPDATDASSHSSKRASSVTGTRGSPNNLGSVESMLTGLEQKLKENPSDAKGWLLLAKSYNHLGRPDDAAVAYARASELGQTDADFEASLSASVAVSSPTIRGRLTVTEAAQARLEPGDSVFIFAKSTDGSAMPVAVLRKQARDLPFDFELSDKQAMSAASRLSTTTTVTITARVSKSGNAMQGEPGLEVVSQPINVGDSSVVELQIDPEHAADST